MEGKETQEGEIERLAELKAKRRLESWSERFKSIHYILFMLLVVLGFPTLLIVWIVELQELIFVYGVFHWLGSSL